LHAANGICGESDDIEKNGTFTQELRLTSPAGGIFDYLFGLYYYDSRSNATRPSEACDPTLRETFPSQPRPP